MDKKTYKLGSAVNLTVTLNREPTLVRITIRNPSGVKVVDSVEMSKEIATVYSYIYQSEDSGQEGMYVAQFEAIVGIYSGKAEDTFYLERMAFE